MKCQGKTKGRTTAVRGWHIYYDCTCKAKYKVTDSNGFSLYLCGRCKNKRLNNYPSEFKVELIKKEEVV